MTDRSALAAALDDACERYADRSAISGNNQMLTYGDLAREIAHVSGVYRSIGVQPRDRIILSIANGPEYIAAVAAAWTIGAVHVGVDADATAAELSRVVAITGARLLVYEARTPQEDARATLSQIRATQPGLGTTVLGEDGKLEVVEVAPVQPNTDASERFADAAIVFISSGTTGAPKATVGFHRNLSQRWSRLGGWLKFGAEDVHLAHLPLSHGFGFMMAMAALLSGGRLVTLRRFSANEVVRTIAAERVTIFNGSPTHFRLLLERRRRLSADVSSLRLSVGTAALFPPPLIEAIWNELSVDFVYMYGSSEGVGVATSDREDIRLGSVGRPPAGSTRVVGADRRELPIGEIGEIAFSRKIYPVAYWAGQSEASDVEWFYSGDLGRLDNLGRLYVFGRLKHQIDRGGMKIDPVEVERALVACADVADAAVIGMPDPILGETVCACVVPGDKVALTLEGIRERLAGELASYKLPAALRILDEIPRTTLGKVDLPRLRATCLAPTA